MVGFGGASKGVASADYADLEFHLLYLSPPQPVTPISSQEEQDKLLDIALTQVKQHGFSMKTSLVSTEFQLILGNCRRCLCVLKYYLLFELRATVVEVEYDQCIVLCFV